MNVIILAGGFGSRLSEYTESIPKPMVSIGNKPILWHIMNIFSSYGHNNFKLALGYKADVVIDYFINYKLFNSNVYIDLGNGDINMDSNDELKWKVTMVNTGLNTMTGGRLKRMRPFIDNETFLLTYGDGLSNVNLDELIDFHKSHGKLITVTAVHPLARFGELNIVNNKVEEFLEKPQINMGWINGGFFVVEPEFLDLINDDTTVLEKTPLEEASRIGELMAYKHSGFWQCMDTRRDRDFLNDLCSLPNKPWLS